VVGRFLGALIRDESGATAIEYGLIVSLIFLVALSAMTAFGVKVTNTMNTVSAAVVAVH
jgi:pilus assembly protein Flp/PilA